MKRLLLPSCLGTLGIACLLALTPNDGDSRPPRRVSTKAQLWKLLVSESLEIVDDPDPLRRANSSRRVADHLEQQIAQAEAEGDQQRAQKLTQLLGKVLDHGIDHNVESVKSSEKEVGAERQAQLQELAKHSDRLHNLFKAFEAKLQAFGKSGFALGKPPMMGPSDHFKGGQDKFGDKFIVPFGGKMDDKGKGKDKFDMGPKKDMKGKGKKGKKDQKIKLFGWRPNTPNGVDGVVLLDHANPTANLDIAFRAHFCRQPDCGLRLSEGVALGLV
jgi:hypothetical protein